MNQSSMGRERTGAGDDRTWGMALVPDYGRATQEGGEQHSAAPERPAMEATALYAKLSDIVASCGPKVLPRWTKAGRDTAVVLGLILPWVVAGIQMDIVRGAIAVAGSIAVVMALDMVRKAWNARVDAKRSAELQKLTAAERRAAFEGVDRLRWVWSRTVETSERVPASRSFGRSRAAGRWEDGVPTTLAPLVRAMCGPEKKA